MSTIPPELLKSSSMTRGTVRAADGPMIEVEIDEDDRGLTCTVLQTGAEEELVLHPGDTVLVWRQGSEGSDGVILGRIAPLEARAVTRRTGAGKSDHLIIEAGRELELRVGTTSILIREDGKILLRGAEITSHATRRNRIRGGSVEIN